MSDAGPAASGSPPPAADEPRDAAPAQTLAEVWELLDLLPDAAASPAMMATTMEMAAAPAAAPAGAATGRGQAWVWLPAGAVVLTALCIGIAAGRATAPSPDAGILNHLPFVQHVDLLAEAGSVAFLEELANRGYPAPRRPPPTRSPADVLADAQAFDAAVASFRGHEPDDDGQTLLASRREQVLGMSERDRRQLEKSVEAFLRLSSSDRRELIAVGRALADPSRRRLLDAARLWHQWIQLRDPADRRDVVDLDTADRLEWLERMMRFEARLEGRGEAVRQFYEQRDPRRRPPQGPGGPDFMQPGPPRPGQPGPPGPMQRPRGPNGPGGAGPGRAVPGEPGPGEPGSRGPEDRGQREGRGPGGRSADGEGGGRPAVSAAPQPPETPARPR